jgi:hypothetical protein
MANWPFESINNLTEFQMYAGRDEELIFDIYDSGSVAVSLSGATCTWKLAGLGQTTATLTKTATVSGSPTNRMVVNLVPSDTASLKGKYVHQPIVVAASGSTYRPAQGIINIVAAIS